MSYSVCAGLWAFTGCMFWCMDREERARYTLCVYLYTEIFCCNLFKEYKRWKMASTTHPSFTWSRLQSDLADS